LIKNWRNLCKVFKGKFSKIVSKKQNFLNQKKFFRFEINRVF